MNNLISIAIGADHRGYAMKEHLMRCKTFGDYEIFWIDVGAFDERRTDYPLYSHAVVHTIKDGRAQYGVLLCGTGIGMAIVANRYQGIYAGLVWNEEVAYLSKEDDNTNVLVLPSDFVTNQQAHAILASWLKASFKEGRYAYRLDLIDPKDER